jgi:hypothetical protein
VSTTLGDTTTRDINVNDSTFALGEWTGTVSNCNKSNDATYNQNLINTGGTLVIAAFAVGSLPLTLKAGASAALPAVVAERLNEIGAPSALSLSGG